MMVLAAGKAENARQKALNVNLRWRANPDRKRKPKKNKRSTKTEPDV